MSEHKQRWQSAAIMLGVILLVGLLDIKIITWAFFGLVLYFAYDEACRLFGVAKENLYIFIVIVWVASYFFKEPILLLFIALLTLASRLAYDKSVDKKDFLPLFYPLAGILFMWSLYLHFGVKSLVWLLIIVALSDVGAYYVGKNFGKTSFSPTSPNKTLEGVFGGVTIAGVVGAIVIASSSQIGFFAALLLAVLTSVAGVFGDLFESYLKREAGVKDSGNIIPGHGGVLDRIDGYLFASVMLYTLLRVGS
jgi:phosphatidate cytidylyltransferase